MKEMALKLLRKHSAHVLGYFVEACKAFLIVKDQELLIISCTSHFTYLFLFLTPLFMHCNRPVIDVRVFWEQRTGKRNPLQPWCFSLQKRSIDYNLFAFNLILPENIDFILMNTRDREFKFICNFAYFDLYKHLLGLAWLLLSVSKQSNLPSHWFPFPW